MTIRYTVYKTVNRSNGKFYLGVHKTSDPNDAYLGSGTYIIRAVAKYGPANFTKEILHEFDSQQEAWDKENELVELHRTDPLCMNLRKGGSGGFDHINRLPNIGLQRSIAGIRGGAAYSKKLKEDPVLLANLIIRVAEVRSSKYLVHALEASRRVWTGKKHSEASCLKMSEAHKGTKNHFTGRKWMTHPELGNKPVKKEEIEAHQKDGWVFGRK